MLEKLRTGFRSGSPLLCDFPLLIDRLDLCWFHLRFDSRLEQFIEERAVVDHGLA